MVAPDLLVHGPAGTTGSAPPVPGAPCSRSPDSGVALLIVMMALALLVALGSALVLTVTTETRIWTRYRDGAVVLHAAGAAITRAAIDLESIPDWSAVPGGEMHSTFTDGPSGGLRTFPSGTGSLDLTELTHLVNCGRRTPCSEGDLHQVTEERPWGRRNPHWRLFAHGPFAAFLPPGDLLSPAYLVVWVADDPADADDDPRTDGGPVASDPDASNPGGGVLVLLAHAYGPDRTRRAIEATVRQTGSGVRIERWRDVR